jgi:hypothetical protein
LLKSYHALVLLGIISSQPCFASNIYCPLSMGGGSVSILGTPFSIVVGSPTPDWTVQSAVVYPYIGQYIAVDVLQVNEKPVKGAPNSVPTTFVLGPYSVVELRGLQLNPSISSPEKCPVIIGP